MSFYLFRLFGVEEFILEDPKTYSFLTNGNLPVPGVDDAAEFKETVNAMNIMGMTTEDYSGLFVNQVFVINISDKILFYFSFSYFPYCKCCNAVWQHAI